MLRMFRIVTFGLLACHVAACATVTPEQRAATCAQTDWQRYGENDGRLGVPTSDRASDFEDCSGAGQPVDLTAYQTGRAKGLQTYCTAENGYQVGYEGRSYDKVCPKSSEQDFLQGYERGREERPAVAIVPGVGIGIGSGGVRTRIGVGIGLFSGHYGRSRHGYRHCGINRFCW
ncbi:MAG: DUF2799 domain-containing protein [Paracoccaceae bacterium]